MMQFQSDILPVKVLRPEIIETTALGAAYLAGLATGFWKDIETIAAQWKVDATFLPQMENEVKEKKLAAWQRAVTAVLAWSK
jgi:glycerol kinase